MSRRLALSILLVALTVPPASASIDAALLGAFSRHRPEQAAHLETLLGGAHRTFGAVTSGSLGGAVEHALDLADTEPAAVTAAPRLDPATVSALARADLRPAERMALTDLTEATVIALRILEASIEVTPELAQAGAEIMRAATDRGHSPALPVGAARTLDRLVDREGVAAAAVVLAAAIDRSLPVLRADARSPATSDARAPGCDLIMVVSLLCVGGPGPNLHDEEHFALTVDLGGDDLWTNSAGSGDVNYCLSSVTSQPSCLMGLALDAGGNDVYRATFRGKEPGRLDAVAQGMAWGGIGWLVDALGDDRYESVLLPNEKGQIMQFTGQGNGTLGGFGLLADLTGDDAYVVDQPVPVTQGAVHGAQGVGIEGIGLLLDVGLGKDTYAIRSVTADPGRSAPYLFGQGLAEFFAVGILADDGGTGSFSIRSEATVGFSGDADSGTTPPGGIYPTATAEGQAFAVNGVGRLLTGPGDTTYELRAVTRIVFDPSGSVDARGAVQGSYAVGQAVSALGETAILQDTGGNDTYRAVSRLEAQAIAEASDGSTSAVLRLEGLPRTYAQARSSFGAAVLFDQIGNDTYETSSQSVQAASATATAAHGADARVDSKILVETAGQGHGGLGFAALVDVAGGDTYALNASSSVDAEARVDNGEGTSYARQLAFWQPAAGAFGQGASDGGVLLDGEGPNTFSARAAAPSRSAPQAARSLDGTTQSLSQASTAGYLAALGPSTFQIAGNFSDPEDGRQGEGPSWSNRDWGGVLYTPFISLGLAPGAAVKAPTGLTFEPPVVGEQILLRARLTDAAGAPLQGREIRFVLGDVADPGIVFVYGLVPFGATSAVTGADGWATVAIDRTMLEREAPVGELTRARASFFGDSTLRGASMVREITS